MLTQLRFEVSNLTAERGHAIQDHLALRDRVASLVTGNPVPISTPIAPIDLIPGAATHFDRNLTNRKRIRKVAPLKEQPVPKKSHSILDLHPQVYPGW